MSREVFTLQQAAEHVHLAANELRHIAQRGEIDAETRSGEWFFEHRALDEWAQRNLLASNERSLTAQYRVMMDEHRRAKTKEWSVAQLIHPAAIDLAIGAKAKAGIIRDMAELAIRSGLVYDADGLYKELAERETAASTAIGEEVALLHPRFHDPYLFESTFLAYGRCDRPIFFGAPDGQGTRHFFVICSTDHEAHLHILARLAMLAHGSDMLARLSDVTEPEEVVAVMAACEAAFQA